MNDVPEPVFVGGRMPKRKADIQLRETDDGNVIVREGKEIKNSKGYTDYTTEERVVVGKEARTLLTMVKGKARKPVQKIKKSIKKKKKKKK